MQSGFFSTFFTQPLGNTLAALLSVIPGANVGVAIIVLTILVRTLLLPLSHKQVVSQSKMREIAPHIEKLKEKHKDDKQEQAKKTMELYKEHGINPLSGCLLVLIQLPIIFALYIVFSKVLPNINAEHLYSFVRLPETIDMMFLGVILSGKSFVFALIAAVAQYYQLKLSVPALPPSEKGAVPSFKDDFARSMNVQMRYMLPIIVFGISYSMSAAIALYWATSNTFSVAHELYVKRKAQEIKA
jgi:YidC/Oxa1 family membrane protein insertase